VSASSITPPMTIRKYSSLFWRQSFDNVSTTSRPLLNGVTNQRSGYVQYAPPSRGVTLYLDALDSEMPCITTGVNWVHTRTYGRPHSPSILVPRLHFVLANLLAPATVYKVWTIQRRKVTRQRDYVLRLGFEIFSHIYMHSLWTKNISLTSAMAVQASIWRLTPYGRALVNQREVLTT
jgi:hypothetical protein